MWCVASAPIVPLARDLDAALGMPRGELAVHFRKLSTPLPTTPLPSRTAPAFFPQGALPLSRPLLSLSGCPRVSSAHRPRRSSLPHSPLELYPRFFHKLSALLLTVPLPSRAAPTFPPQGALSLLLSAGSLRAFPPLRHVPPRSTPLPPPGHLSEGDLLPKTQKNEHRSLGSGARFGLLSGRHSAEWC